MSHEMIDRTLDNPFDISIEQNKGEIERASDLMTYKNNLEEAWKIYNRLAKEASDEEVQSIYELKADSILNQMKEETEKIKSQLIIHLKKIMDFAVDNVSRLIVRVAKREWMKHVKLAPSIKQKIK